MIQIEIGNGEEFVAGERIAFELPPSMWGLRCDPWGECSNVPSVLVLERWWWESRWRCCGLVCASCASSKLGREFRRHPFASTPV